MTKTQSKDIDSLALEDLFRLKRAETPPEGFWQQFEDEFHQKSMRELGQTTRHQRRSLWHGWGLGTCMASVLSLALPVFLLLQPESPSRVAADQENSQGVSGTPSVQQATILPVANKPWHEVQAMDSLFVIETLEVGEPRQMAADFSQADLRLQSNDGSQFVTDSLTLGSYAVGAVRTPSFF